jgi:beta-lactamase superfamily II metal-dependent hydrolase
VITVQALPAAEGDCLWVEWTAPDGIGRMLIDGGRSAGSTVPVMLANRIAHLPASDRHIDLVVCTHIDIDHIGGILGLFRDWPPGLTVGDVWFNGRDHLRADVLGPRQGDQLGAILKAGRWPWNAAFGGQAVVVGDDGVLPVFELRGLTLTLLGPRWPHLHRLDDVWSAVIAETQQVVDEPSDLLGADRDLGRPLEELAVAEYEPDVSPANASSIAFLAEDGEGGRVLFAADAPAEILEAGLSRAWPSGPLRVDVCKAPHHGSAHNISPGLLRALKCRHWLISTNGARFGHPSRRAVARIIAAGGDPVLWFNHAGPTTEEFSRWSLRRRHGFEAHYPVADGHGIALTIAGRQVARARA